jgi:hypothetical protein
MAYFMRFLITGDYSPSVENMRQTLVSRDASYELISRQPVPYETLVLTHAGEEYAEIDFNRPGDDLFADELDDLLEELDETVFDTEEDSRVRDVVAEQVRETRLILSAEILFGDNFLEDGIRLIDPLWDWLFEQTDGLLKIDNEGYYDADGLLLSIEEG